MLDGKKSRWRRQKNGLPQGSVLAPLLFNVYTNDQPICPQAKHFACADDLTIGVKGKTYQDIERKLEEALSIMGKYYL